MKKTTMYAIDLILLAGTFLAVLFAVGYATPRVISPIDGEVTSESSVLFSFENGNEVLIDDNPEFTSPEEIYVKDNLVINLKPGHYYWKVNGILGSEVNEITILSEIELKLRSAGDKIEVVNAGNVDLNVDVYTNSVLNESLVLKVDESKNVSGTKIIGSQNG